MPRLLKACSKAGDLEAQVSMNFSRTCPYKTLRGILEKKTGQVVSVYAKKVLGNSALKMRNSRQEYSCPF